MKKAPSTTPLTRPMPPRSETPPMTQAAIDWSAMVPPRLASPDSTRAVSSKPSIEARKALAAYAISKVAVMLMPESFAARNHGDCKDGDGNWHAENAGEAEHVSEPVRKAGHRHAPVRNRANSRAHRLNAERHGEGGNPEDRDPFPIDEADEERNRCGAKAASGDDEPDRIGNGGDDRFLKIGDDRRNEGTLA